VSGAQAQSRIRVRYAETDQMGVAWHGSYFAWFEVGRTDLLRNAGWTYREMEAGGVSLPVIEAHCDYKQAAKYDDELEIRTAGTLVSPVRVAFSYEVIRPADSLTVATGRTVHAAVDRSGRPCKLPDRVKGMFT